MSLAMGSLLYPAVRVVDGGTVPFCSVGCDELRSKLLSPGRCESGIAEALERRHFGHQVCLAGFKKIPESIFARFLDLSTFRYEGPEKTSHSPNRLETSLYHRQR